MKGFTFFLGESEDNQLVEPAGQWENRCGGSEVQLGILVELVG